MTDLRKIDMWSDNGNIGKNEFKIKTIKTLVRQCSRWAVAAQQDTSPMVALLHANYATGYLWALRDIATDKDIQSIASINILEFQKQITDVQDKCTKLVSKTCPKFIGDVDKLLLKVAGDM